jgi:hypothetical protein
LTSFQWPGLHNLVIRSAPVVAKNAPYAATYAINFLSAAGTAIFVAGLLSLLIIPNYSVSRSVSCFGRTIKVLIFGDCYNQPIYSQNNPNPNHIKKYIPKSVKYLTFGARYNQSIKNGLPPLLKCLTFNK